MDANVTMTSLESAQNPVQSNNLSAETTPSEIKAEPQTKEKPKIKDEPKIECKRESVMDEPDFAVVCAFVSRFGLMLNVWGNNENGEPADRLTIAQLERALADDAKSDSSDFKRLIELQVRLLRRLKKTVSRDKWERAFVKFAHSFSSVDAFDIEEKGYAKVKASVKLRLLKHLLEAQFDVNPKLKNDCGHLRSQPIGSDRLGNSYWYQVDDEANLRVYKEDHEEETWELVADSREQLAELIEHLRHNDTFSRRRVENAVDEEDESMQGIEDILLDTAGYSNLGTSVQNSAYNSDSEDKEVKARPLDESNAALTTDLSTVKSDMNGESIGDTAKNDPATLVSSNSVPPVPIVESVKKLPALSEKQPSSLSKHSIASIISEDTGHNDSQQSEIPSLPQIQTGDSVMVSSDNTFDQKNEQELSNNYLGTLSVTGSESGSQVSLKASSYVRDSQISSEASKLASTSSMCLYRNSLKEDKLSESDHSNDLLQPRSQAVEEKKNNFQRPEQAHPHAQLEYSTPSDVNMSKDSDATLVQDCHVPSDNESEKHSDNQQMKVNTTKHDQENRKTLAEQNPFSIVNFVEDEKKKSFSEESRKCNDHSQQKAEDGDKPVVNIEIEPGCITQSSDSGELIKEDLQLAAPHCSMQFEETTLIHQKESRMDVEESILVEKYTDVHKQNCELVHQRNDNVAEESDKDQTSIVAATERKGDLEFNVSVGSEERSTVVASTQKNIEGKREDGGKNEALIDLNHQKRSVKSKESNKSAEQSSKLVATECKIESKRTEIEEKEVQSVEKGNTSKKVPTTPEVVNDKSTKAKDECSSEVSQSVQKESELKVECKTGADIIEVLRQPTKGSKCQEPLASQEANQESTEKIAHEEEKVTESDPENIQMNEKDEHLSNNERTSVLGNETISELEEEDGIKRKGLAIQIDIETTLEPVGQKYNKSFEQPTHEPFSTNNSEQESIKVPSTESSTGINARCRPLLPPPQNPENESTTKPCKKSTELNLEVSSNQDHHSNGQNKVIRMQDTNVSNKDLADDGKNSRLETEPVVVNETGEAEDAVTVVKELSSVVHRETRDQREAVREQATEHVGKGSFHSEQTANVGQTEPIAEVSENIEEPILGVTSGNVSSNVVSRESETKSDTITLLNPGQEEKEEENNVSEIRAPKRDANEPEENESEASSEKISRVGSDAEVPTFSEVIESEPFVVSGEGSGAACDAGNTVSEAQNGTAVKEEMSEDNQNNEEADEDQVPSKKKRLNGKNSLDTFDILPRRSSGRIAALRIKEAERRQREEEAALGEFKKLKDNKKKSTSKRARDDNYSHEDDNDEDDDEDGGNEDHKPGRKRRRRRKKKRRRGDEPFKQFERFCSGDSSEEGVDVEDPVPEEEEEEEEDDNLFRSDHEFSCESDVPDEEFQPVQHARTATKKRHDRRQEVEEIEEEDEEFACKKCNKADRPEWMLLCDKCDSGWHTWCLRPSLMVIPEGNWYCPDCKHLTLIEQLEENLKVFDTLLKKREADIKRKERLAFVSLSLSNIIPSSNGRKSVVKNDDNGGGKYHKARATKKRRVRADVSDEDESAISSEGDSSSSESSDDVEEEEEEMDETLFGKRRRATKNVTYSLKKYDDMIKSALADEEEEETVEPATALEEDYEEGPKGEEDFRSPTGRSGMGMGKDIANCELDDEDKDDKDKDDKDEDNEYQDQPQTSNGPPLQKDKKRKKLSDLNASDSENDGDSGSDFEVDSLNEDEEEEEEDGEEEEEEEEDEDEDLGNASKRCNDVGDVRRRSKRSRKVIYDSDFVIDGSDSDEDVSRKRRAKQKGDESWDDEDEDEEDLEERYSGAVKKKPFVKKTKSKSKNIFTGSNEEDEDEPDRDFEIKVNRKQKKLLKESAANRTTRGKKVSYSGALSDDDEEDALLLKLDAEAKRRNTLLKKKKGKKWESSESEADSMPELDDEEEEDDDD